MFVFIVLYIGALPLIGYLSYQNQLSTFDVMFCQTQRPQWIPGQVVSLNGKTLWTYVGPSQPYL